ncbi:MAG TPA: hypothetical protein VFB83_08375 [Propionibacteriaceae bacterium]|nr:hypothetical protein [Propionibacteriaceae bacterium]
MCPEPGVLGRPVQRRSGEIDRSGALWAATLGNEDPPAPGTLVKIIKVRANP